MADQMFTLLAVLAVYPLRSTADIIPTANECLNYTTLHEADRSRYFSSNTTAPSDNSLDGWFTFNGSAGVQVASSCVPANHCGTLFPGWMRGIHPSVKEGAVKRSMCLSRLQRCCMHRLSMNVRNCSGFYVYKLVVTSSLKVNFRVCGDSAGGMPMFIGIGPNRTKGNTEDGCHHFSTLDEGDRAETFFSFHTLKCDAKLPQTWYKFTGRAGTEMPTHCVPQLHCGTLSPGWLNGLHPKVSEGVVERMVCFTKNDDCCYWYSQVKVRNCGNFFVYKFGQLPVFGHMCSLRYCGNGKKGLIQGCKDNSGNMYEVGQTWRPNKLFQCTCKRFSAVTCSRTGDGCWDLQGNTFVEGQKWLKDSVTKCVCKNQQIKCTNLSRPACVDENQRIREHGTQWFPSPCFNCSCADGLVACIKNHVTVAYGYFEVKAVGSCKPCRQPLQDIVPIGEGSASACHVLLSLSKSDELSRCANGDYIRKIHLCNGVAECMDGSDELGCGNKICRDEDGRLLVLKKEWQVSKCMRCVCSGGYLQCTRKLKVNFPGSYFGYVPFIEDCKQPTCNILEFIKKRKDVCQAIETTEGGQIVFERSTWEYQECKFYFPGQKDVTGCPPMKMRTCYMYNGAICCAQPCPALAQLATQVRWNMSLCGDHLHLTANRDTCDTPSPNCLPTNQGDDCRGVTCQDEDGNSYFEGVTWSVGECINCRCTNGSISCSRQIEMITSEDTKTETCYQPMCSVATFMKLHRGICKACEWKKQIFYDGDRWTENGVDFFCSSKQRVRPGCYLEKDKVLCTGAFKAIQNLTLISDDELILCESGDEIRPLNDWCNLREDCYDKSDERVCPQYFCPSHVQFNLVWKRTPLGSTVFRNCSEMDPKLGGTFTSRCTKTLLSTAWKHKRTCDCERQSLLEEYTSKISLVNISKLAELANELMNASSNFTNKEVLFGFVSKLFHTGALLLSPINQDNDLETFQFTKTIYTMLGKRDVFSVPDDSFCQQTVGVIPVYNLKGSILDFVCKAPNSTVTYAFCKEKWPLGPLALPSYREDSAIVLPALRPGNTQFWLRPVLTLKINPNQLTSEIRDSPNQSLTNSSAVLNETNGQSFLEDANCSLIEVDENGTVRTTARQIDDELTDKALVQGYLELVLSSISTIAVILSLIMLSCLRLRNSERIFVHKNLLLSLCLVYIVMILDTFVFTKRKETPTLCSFMAVIQHLVHTAMFSWMLVEGIHLYIKLVKVFSVRKLYITYILIGWGVPVVIVGMIAAIRPHTYDMSKTYHKDVMCGSLKLTAEIVRTRCWLEDGEWLYKGPILGILLVNLVIFLVLLRVIFTKISMKYGTDNVEKTRRGLKSVAALLPLLGVTWLLGFTVHLSEVLLYIFIILNSLQGLAFCIFHSLLDDQIREGVAKSLRRSRMKNASRNEIYSTASTTTQISPPDSVRGQDQNKARKDIHAITELDTKL